MSKTLMNLSAAAFAVMAALPAWSEEISAETVIATVGDTKITLGHMIMVRSGLPEQYQQLPADVLWDGILDQLIQQEAMAQDDLAKETLRVRLAMENERRSLLAAEAITVVADQAVTDEAIQAAYQANYVDGVKGKEYNASHILVETEEEAAAILAEVKGGADFAETAKAKSTGPSGPNGGALGWFSAGMMVEPFQIAVESLENGDITGPVQTQFGWHVIKLNETRVMAAPELEAVREEIIGTLQQDAVSGYIDGLVEKAEVSKMDKAEVDPSILTNTELLED
ncbi:peptidylprolyl isomerase [Tropicibacter oceani]|uniref:Parvulin-like PPIase n=1 Tax=Tropicibacter oceani TaxID=3058420 RepID=A0ABY8QID6_9RHOB|nr:peptidylprolyl isomerase [Tropicibacter oceani]WGW04299.1 peptidylprolyl isomerase [Tropicibacter oceani]